MALEQMRFTGALIAVFIAISAVIIAVLKFGIDSYRDEKDLKTTIIVFLSVFISLMIIFLVLREFFPSDSNICLLLTLLSLLILSTLVLNIYYSIQIYSEYKEDRNTKKFRINITVILLFFIIIISSMVVSWEYANTPDARQRFVLTLEQNETSEIELIIPNLEGENEYVPIDCYEIVKGKGEISTYQNGEYLRIQTSSKQLKMKYSEKAKMFTEFHGEYDFQYDKLHDVPDEYHLRSMGLSYDSEQNITCHLNLRWKDDYEARYLWDSHLFLVEGDAYIDNNTEQMTVFVERMTV